MKSCGMPLLDKLGLICGSRVRNKIETEGHQYIKTVYGMGYMWIGGASK